MVIYKPPNVCQRGFNTCFATTSFSGWHLCPGCCRSGQFWAGSPHQKTSLSMALSGSRRGCQKVPAGSCMAKALGESFRRQPVDVEVAPGRRSVLGWEMPPPASSLPPTVHHCPHGALLESLGMYGSTALPHTKPSREGSCSPPLLETFEQVLGTGFLSSLKTHSFSLWVSKNLSLLINTLQFLSLQGCTEKPRDAM